MEDGVDLIEPFTCSGHGLSIGAATRVIDDCCPMCRVNTLEPEYKPFKSLLEVAATTSADQLHQTIDATGLTTEEQKARGWIKEEDSCSNPGG